MDSSLYTLAHLFTSSVSVLYLVLSNSLQTLNIPQLLTFHECLRHKSHQSQPTSPDISNHTTQTHAASHPSNQKPTFFFSKKFPNSKTKFTTCSTKCLTETNKLYFAFFPYLFFGNQLMQPLFYISNHTLSILMTHPGSCPQERLENETKDKGTRVPDLLNLLQLLVIHQSKWVGMARKVKRKGKGISESQDSQLQETQLTRPSSDHNEVCEQELSQILRPSSEPQTDEGAPQASNSIIIGTNVGKKRGRGKAKGINAGDGEIEVEIYDGKIITPKATREITILFHQKLNGAWTTFTEYPNSELETLYARYRAQRFKHKQLDEEVKKAFIESVKHRYSDWMFRIRNPIFQKYEEKEDRYKNGPSFIPTPFWKEMVDKWMVKDWGETSSTNKGNRNKSKIFSTTGSVPMAKYRYEMYLETGSEPSPIDCFKKFHTKKDGKEWATDHAKTLYEKMDAIKAKAVSEGTKTNDYQIFREVVGEPSHGRILGMGIGIKAKDVYGLTSSGKGCSKRCREDFTKEKEDLEARLREEMDSKLAKVVEKLEEKFAQKLQSMGIPLQSDVDPVITDGTSRDEEHNSNNNIEVENNLESDSEED